MKSVGRELVRYIETVTCHVIFWEIEINSLDGDLNRSIGMEAEMITRLSRKRQDLKVSVLDLILVDLGNFPFSVHLFYGGFGVFAVLLASGEEYDGYGHRS